MKDGSTDVSYGLTDVGYGSTDVDYGSTDVSYGISVVLKATMKDTDKKKPTVHDLTIYLRESSYLPDSREE